VSAERLALVKRYADALWRDPPDYSTAPEWALRPWIGGDADLPIPHTERAALT
jgi:hypothetical protein